MLYRHASNFAKNDKTVLFFVHIHIEPLKILILLNVYSSCLPAALHNSDHTSGITVVLHGAISGTVYITRSSYSMGDGAFTLW